MFRADVISKRYSVEEDIKKRKWKWVGHTLAKAAISITRQALTRYPKGKRKRGRPRNSRRDLGMDSRMMGYSWSYIETLAED